MRPNFAQDAPPTEITVGGFSYACNTDYRVWIEVVQLIAKLNLHPKTDESARKTIDSILEIERLVFGKRLEADFGEVLKCISEFSKGYPMAPIKSTASEAPTYSFDYDLNAIIIAIRNQSGIDLSYRCKYFHWWEFLLEFQTLCGDHYILNLMEARGYRGKDKELRRRRDACALPYEFTPEEIEEYEIMMSEFEEDNDEQD